MAVRYAHWDSDKVFDYENNRLNFAAGITAYDGNQEPIENPDYGTLKFAFYNWGGEGTVGSKFTVLKTH